MLKPNCEWTKFTTENEKIRKYKEWGFIAPRQKWLRAIFYCGLFCNIPSVCDIIGYIDDSRVVLDVDGTLHTIHPDYLLQMQPCSPSQYPDKYVVLDLETTGFSPSKNKILEIAAVKYKRDMELDTFHTMVNPNCSLNRLAQSVNHIDSSMICDAPCVEDVIPLLMDFIGDLPIVAHNSTFDMGFLKNESQSLGIKITNTIFDTLKLSKDAFPEFKSHSLSTLVKELDIGTHNTHRALPDVQATAILFQKCLQKLYPAKKFTLSYQED